MTAPFDLIKGINAKTYSYDLSSYNPFLTNRAFAFHIDTVMLAEEMNQAHHLSPSLQYDFYFYTVRRGKRFGFPKKPDDDNVSIVMKYFDYSRQKALEAMRLLTEDDIRGMISSMDTGGR